MRNLQDLTIEHIQDKGMLIPLQVFGDPCSHNTLRMFLAFVVMSKCHPSSRAR